MKLSSEANATHDGNTPYGTNTFGSVNPPNPLEANKHTYRAANLEMIWVEPRFTMGSLSLKLGEKKMRRSTSLT